MFINSKAMNEIYMEWIHSTWIPWNIFIPHGFHMDSMWNIYIPYGIHVESTYMPDGMYIFHMESME